LNANVAAIEGRLDITLLLSQIAPVNNVAKNALVGLQEEFAGVEGCSSAAAAAVRKISQTSIPPLEAIGTPDRDILVKLARQR
jgi:hypothetical protein